MRDAVVSEAAALEGLSEPVAVIEAVGDTFAALDDALAELALPRLRVIAELRRQGWSYDRIASARDESRSWPATRAADSCDLRIRVGLEAP